MLYYEKLSRFSEVYFFLSYSIDGRCPLPIFWNNWIPLFSKRTDSFLVVLFLLLSFSIVHYEDGSFFHNKFHSNITAVYSKYFISDIFTPAMVFRWIKFEGTSSRVSRTTHSILAHLSYIFQMVTAYPPISSSFSPLTKPSGIVPTVILMESSNYLSFFFLHSEVRWDS